jgi:hypothetical protein
MTSKEVILCALAVAAVIVIGLGICFAQDVKSYLDYLVMLFLGHHASQQPSDDITSDSLQPKIVDCAYTPPEKKSARMKITHYGEPNDPYGDTLTREGWGNANNRLTLDACALTKSAKMILDAKEYDWLEIDFGNGTIIKKQYQDFAPEAEERLDIYNPGGLKLGYPDYANVSVVGSGVDLTA